MEEIGTEGCCPKEDRLLEPGVPEQRGKWGRGEDSSQKEKQGK